MVIIIYCLFNIIFELTKKINIRIFIYTKIILHNIYIVTNFMI